MYRSDFPYKFRVNPATVQSLIDRIDATLELGIAMEGPKGATREDITNYEEVRAQVISKLEALRDNPSFEVRSAYGVLLALLPLP